MIDQMFPLILAGFLMFAVIRALIFFSNAYNLDGIKSKTVAMDSMVRHDLPQKEK